MQDTEGQSRPVKAGRLARAFVGVVDAGGAGQVRERRRDAEWVHGEDDAETAPEPSAVRGQDAIVVEAQVGIGHDERADEEILTHGKGERRRCAK